MTKRVAEGERIQAATGKTYYTATRLFPERVRAHTHALYGFARTADDFVDKPKGTSHEQRTAVEDYRRRTIAAVRDPAAETDPVIRAFAETVRECKIPELEIHAFMDAMAADSFKKRYRDLHDLQGYMRGSAVAVGNMMVAIMGFTGEPTNVKRQSRALSEAFQMTNFLRDVGEDYHELGRIYLPQTTMHKHGMSEDDIKKRLSSPAMRKTIAELSVWTRTQYHEGVAGIKHLSKDCRFAVLVASVLYLRVLEKLEAQNFDVFGPRPRVAGAEKAAILARVWFEYVVLKRSELRVARLTHQKH